MPEVREGIYIPEVGDRINYTEGTRRLEYSSLVTKTECMGGYTGVWVGGMSEDNDPLFNINHFTGRPNTEYSRNGKWMLVSKRSDPVVPRTFTLPVIPDDVDRIASIPTGTQFTRVKNPATPELWTHVTLGGFWTVSEMLASFPDGFEEVTESTYEAAVRRLRASGFTRTTTGALTYSQTVDTRIIAAHVVEDSNV